MQSRITSLRGGGHPLPESVRSYFQPRFGYDFSGVRVHTNAAAAKAAQKINARAFTLGKDVTFGASQYSPETTEGKKLLAHELTHVVQQGRTDHPAQSRNSEPALETRLGRNRKGLTAELLLRQSSVAVSLQLPSCEAELQRQADISKLPPRMPCVTITGPGHPVGTNIVFSSGSTLTASHKTHIAAFRTSWTAAGAASDISIDGFSSPGGAQTSNWQLSCDRAKAVKAEFVALGVPGTRITTFAHGESTEFAPAVQNRRAIVHTLTPLGPTDLQVRGVPSGGPADAILFDRNDFVVRPPQDTKIAPLASPPGTAFTLFGFVSEDENVPAAAGTTLATNRISSVSTALGIAGHTAARTADLSQISFGTGQIDYRGMRKVVVKPTGTPSGVPSCAAGPPAALVGCAPASHFTSAQARANALLTPVITALAPPLLPATETLLDDRFGTTAATRTAVAALVRTNLSNLRPHITAQMTPVSALGPAPAFVPSPGHRCANTCDAACAGNATAYNMDQDAAAVMTLCDTPTGFMRQPALNERAATLIHEGLHGITLRVGPLPAATEPGTTDFSYQEQRLIRFLDAATALKNTDSYVAFVRQMSGHAITIGRSVPDTATGLAMSAAERREVDQAIAWLEGWIIWADQETGSLFDTISASITAVSWTNAYYEDTMSLVAPRFGLSIPPAVPSQSDQFAVAAINEKFGRMSRVLYNVTSLTIERVAGGTTDWSAGPGFSLTAAPDFFGLPTSGRARAQLDLLLQKIVGATSNISSSAVARYTDLVNQIRIHQGGGAP